MASPDYFPLCTPADLSIPCTRDPAAGRNTFIGEWGFTPGLEGAASTIIIDVLCRRGGLRLVREEHRRVQY